MLEVKEILNICKQICSGLCYLHSKHIIHKDIKSFNILLKEDSINEITVKIADFGLSKFRTHTLTFCIFKGTPAYSAPEVFSNQKVNEKIDIFALGILFWEIWSRQRPFEQESLPQVINNICKGIRPELPVYKICIYLMNI